MHRFLRSLVAIAVATVAATAGAVPWGVNAHVPSTELLDLAREAGIRWVRIDFVWSWVEPEQDRFDWSVYDAVADAAAARGLELYATVIDTPAWATSGNPGTGVPDDPADWYDLCYRAADRYRGRIDHWGMWNEPNSKRFWTGKRSEYIEIILRNGSRAVHAANPDAKVCGPDLGHLQSGDWDDWLDDVLKLASDSLDVVTHHVYPDGLANSVVQALVSGGDYPWDPPSVREILKKRGWLGRPVWLTETGYNSGADGDGEFSQSLFVSQLFTALYGPYRSVDWVSRVFIYELVDDSRFQARWGLVGPEPEHRLKPAYEALRGAAARLAVDDAEVVGAWLPERLAPGAAATAVVRLRNTGSTTWSAAQGYRLAAADGADPFAEPTHELSEGVEVAPGAEVELRFALAAGLATTPPGGVLTAWRMERDGTAFGEHVRRFVRVTTESEPVRWVVPAAANAAGVNGTSWHTDLVLHNPTADPLEVSIAALEQERDNSRPRTTRLTVAAGASLQVPDAVARLFGLSATVALRVEAERPELRISSRTYTRLASGTRGEFIPALRVASATTPAAEPRLIGLGRSADPTTGSRTNLGLINPTPAAATVDVEFRDGAGAPLGTVSVRLGGWGYTQITDVLASLTDGDVSGATATVHGRDGAAPIAYVAAVDNRSGDPSIVVAAPPSDAPVIIPAAAHATGVADSRWRTDLQLHNPDDQAGSVAIELLAGPTPTTRTRELASGEGQHLEDVLATLFSIQGVAPLRLSSSTTRTLIGSRTYALSEDGAAGQFVPAVAESDAADDASTVRLLQLSYSPDRKRGFRTNLGFVNPSEQPITLRIDLYRSPSTLLGSAYTNVPARAGAQINDAFARWTSLDVEDGFAVVRAVTTGARFVAWASVVDNRTVDPSFTLGQPD